MCEGESTTNYTCAAVTARSEHPGLVHALPLDGASRAINNNLNLMVWRSLSTRAGRELIGEF